MSHDEPIVCDGVHGRGVMIAHMCVSACSAFLSIVGSSTIIYIILSAGRAKLSYVHNRIFFMMSLIDILSSIAWGLSFIPTPKNPACPSHGMGTIATCTAQGFFVQLGVAVPGYTAMLSMCSLVTIVHNVREATIARNYEVFMHVIVIVPMLSVAISGAVNKLFYSNNMACWIGDKTIYGKLPDNLGWNLFGPGVWVVLITMIYLTLAYTVTLYCLIKIFIALRQRSLRMRRYNFLPSSSSSRYNVGRRSNIDTAGLEAAKQAMTYIGGFMLTYVWSSLSVAIPIDKVRHSPVLYIITGIFLPLQGFWNFIAYIRPRFVTLKLEHQDLSFLAAMKEIVFSSRQQFERRQTIRRLRERRRSSITLSRLNDMLEAVALEAENDDAINSDSSESIIALPLTTEHHTTHDFPHDIEEEDDHAMNPPERHATHDFPQDLDEEEDNVMNTPELHTTHDFPKD